MIFRSADTTVAKVQIKIISRFVVGILMGVVVGGCSGAGLEPIQMEDKPLSSPLPINTRPKVLAIGSGFSVGIKKDGTVWTWGSNYKGILARPISKPEEGYEPGQVPGLKDAVSVSASGSVLVLTQDGAVWSWGGNNHNHLDYELNEKKLRVPSAPSTPRKVLGLPKVIDIVSAGEMSVALAENGVIWAWGGGGKNTLFNIDGGVKDYRPPTPIKGLPLIKKISSSAGVIAAIDTDGQLWTVGIKSESGRKPSKTEDPSTLIGRVVLPGKVADVDLGAFLSAIALLENGQVWTWGWNSSGQLGQGHSHSTYSPERINTLNRVRHVSGSMEYMAAITDEGDVLYWGSLIYGPSPEPLASTKLNVDSPIKIKSGVRAYELVTGSAAVAYLDDQGRAWDCQTNCVTS